mgnify:CR=1 FL=1
MFGCEKVYVIDSDLPIYNDELDEWDTIPGGTKIECIVTVNNMVRIEKIATPTSDKKYEKYIGQYLPEIYFEKHAGNSFSVLA